MEVREIQRMIRICSAIADSNIEGPYEKEHKWPLGAESDPLATISKKMGTSVLQLQKT